MKKRANSLPAQTQPPKKGARKKRGPSSSSKSRATFDQSNGVRALARERVGTVKPSRPILPRNKRAPRHKDFMGLDKDEDKD